MKIVHTKRKTIVLVVENDGSLTVRAPLWASRVKIEQFIKEKSEWIQKRQEWIRLHSDASHRFEEGELFYFLGKAYPLVYASNLQQQFFFNDKFHLSRSQQNHAKKVFIAWYRDRARQIISERIIILAKCHDFSYKQIRITSARTRWGSCSSRGTLNFSWRLVMAPLEVIDYVIVHELAHLRIKNHSADFWKFLGQISPDYKSHRLWLKENGVRLNL